MSEETWWRLTWDPNVVQRMPDTTFVPRGSWLWPEYEAWVEAGNTPGDPSGPMPPMLAGGGGGGPSNGPAE